MNKLDILRNFPLYGNQETIFNILEQYDLYTDTIEMPGDIVIIGKNIALPLITFSNLMETQTIGDRTRLIYGFDSFEKNELFHNKEKYSEMLKTSIDIFNQDRFVGWKDRIVYKDQDIETFESFLNENRGLKISLLYCVNIKNQELNLNKLIAPHLIKNAKVIFKSI